LEARTSFFVYEINSAFTLAGAAERWPLLESRSTGIEFCHGREGDILAVEGGLFGAGGQDVAHLLGVPDFVVLEPDIKTTLALASKIGSE